ncbi:Cochaperone protein [Yamadazyma tenuis]|nr:Cochaperone protein [Yamadazyma tenuis]
MAADKLIKQGDSYLRNKAYPEAIDAYTDYLKQSPKALQALLQRSVAFQRSGDLAKAKEDIVKAFNIAQQTGKKQDIGDCFYRLAIYHYSKNNCGKASKFLDRAEQLDCREPSLAIWKAKSHKDVQAILAKPDGPHQLQAQLAPEDSWETMLESRFVAHQDQLKHSEEGISKINLSKPIPVAADKKTSQAASPQSKSTSIDEINKHAPLKIKIREDWYQTKDEVVITIYAKNINPESVHIQFRPRAVSVEFPSGSGSEYNYNLDPLYGAIDTSKCEYTVKSTKIEITLAKKTAHKWTALEASAGSADIVHEETPQTEQTGLVYPTSSKKAINWASFSVEEEEEKDEDPNAFFSKIYKDADDEARRAMMKSFTQSNGTVLTTDWSEAQAKTFETSPPDGMESKKWT